WSNVSPGTYSLTAVATDSTGMSGTSLPVTVTENALVVPTVSLTSPSNNASYTTPANITLTANVGATNATVSRVIFFNGSKILGTASSSPYTYTWNNP